ncbi:MAG: hypothetical protein ABSG32_29375, partial [Terriglobia bacterium]
CSMKFQLRRSCNFNRSREGKSLPEDLIQQVTSMPNFGIQVERSAQINNSSSLAPLGGEGGPQGGG